MAARSQEAIYGHRVNKWKLETFWHWTPSLFLRDKRKIKWKHSCILCKCCGHKALFSSLCLGYRVAIPHTEDLSYNHEYTNCFKMQMWDKQKESKLQAVLMSVSQILGVASLYSFITVIIITNCQTYDHQWMHNVWSGFRSDNDDWIISDIHKPDQQESSSQPPASANWFWYITEPHLYRIHFLRTEIYKMHNHWQASTSAKTQLFWILIDAWSFESIWSSNSIVHH